MVALEKKVLYLDNSDKCGIIRKLGMNILASQSLYNPPHYNIINIDFNMLVIQPCCGTPKRIHVNFYKDYRKMTVSLVNHF